MPFSIFLLASSGESFSTTPLTSRPDRLHLGGIDIPVSKHFLKVRGATVLINWFDELIVLPAHLLIFSRSKLILSHINRFWF